MGASQAGQLLPGEFLMSLWKTGVDFKDKSRAPSLSCTWEAWQLRRCEV